MNGSFRDSWKWLLGLYTVAGFVETVFWGQMMAFTPLFLRQLGMAPAHIPSMVGIIAAIVGALWRTDIHGSRWWFAHFLSISWPGSWRCWQGTSGSSWWGVPS